MVEDGNWWVRKETEKHTSDAKIFFFGNLKIHTRNFILSLDRESNNVFIVLRFFFASFSLCLAPHRPSSCMSCCCCRTTDKNSCRWSMLIFLLFFRVHGLIIFGLWNFYHGSERSSEFRIRKLDLLNFFWAFKIFDMKSHYTIWWVWPSLNCIWRSWHERKITLNFRWNSMRWDEEENFYEFWIFFSELPCSRWKFAKRKISWWKLIFCLSWSLADRGKGEKIAPRHSWIFYVFMSYPPSACFSVHLIIISGQLRKTTAKNGKNEKSSQFHRMAEGLKCSLASKL